jgi:hypothetical protein
MRDAAGAVVAVAFALSACTMPPAWSERVDVTVEVYAPNFAASATSDVASPATSPSGVLMICVIDSDSGAQCYHRRGVISARAKLASGVATCPGADAVLRSICPDAKACRFPEVPVPSSPFGLMIVELRAPRFGIPRHAIVDAAVVSGVSLRSTVPEAARIGQAVHALARCLSPEASDDAPRLLSVERTSCADGFCQLGQSRVKFSSPQRNGVTAKRNLED